ncbi:MAG: hypothetical protein OEZ57_15210 [Nitrospirota bacterium]|nr:hypothetical protein [Nitrospirota bacterium]MDH5585545.1 hypothetical protein [Nitrospirota bacterium]MDH5776252.1 hypothetical protein [Nitrospirota bacterium]
MRYLPITAFLLALTLGPTVSESAQPAVSSVIDQFVSQIYPKGSRYFWVINDTTSDVSNEIIVDINTELQVNSEEDPQTNRFLLLLVKGRLIGAQQIPLGANVNCHNDEKEI